MACTLGLLIGTASARTIEIIEAETLELRNVVPAEGQPAQELVIISGPLVELHVDRDVILAKRVEFNRSTRTLTLVGAGVYRTFTRDARGVEDQQELRGENLVVNLANEGVQGEDVLVSTSQIEVRGAEIERVPGQLKVNQGYFTPCGRCGQTPNDYAFRAKQLTIYPGDRLVAYDAIILLADEPVMYLPLVVLLLNDPDRQPRLEFGNEEGANGDGRFLLLDLPYVVGGNAFGFTLLRYYQNRPAQFGFGVEHTAYNLLGTLSRLDLEAIAEPQRRSDGSGYNYNLDLRWQGKAELLGATDGLNFDLRMRRQDFYDSGSVRGLQNSTSEHGVTRVNFGIKGSWPRADLEFNYVDLFDNEPETPAPEEVLKRPEFKLDPKVFTLGNLSADFAITFGNYRAPVDPSNRSARLQGPTIEAVRLLEQHTINYSTDLWQGANFSVSNTFTGQYYSTGERAVNLNIDARLTQTFSVGNSVALAYNYARLEGESPFFFDRIAGRRLNHSLTLSGAFRPWPWLNVDASQTYDLLKPGDRQPAAQFGVRLNPDPLDLNVRLERNFFTGAGLERWTVNLGLGRQGPSFSVNTGFTAATGRYDPLVVRLGLSDGNRSNNFTVETRFDLNTGKYDRHSLSLAATETGDHPNKITVSASEAYTFSNSRLDGSFSVGSPYLKFGVQHSLLLTQDPARQATADTSSSLTATLGSGSSANNPSWLLTYGGPYNPYLGGWTKPSLKGEFRITRTGQVLDASAQLNMPGLQQSDIELRSATLRAQFEVTPRIGLQGNFSYSQYGTGNARQDTFNFSPLGVTFALGGGEGRAPDAFFTAALNQSIALKAGETFSARLEPIFIMTINRCCWALQAELNASSQNPRFRVGLVLPAGGTAPIVDVLKNQTQFFPGLSSGQ